jgi:capsular polysaccharide biosynthesis protein
MSKRSVPGTTLRSRRLAHKSSDLRTRALAHRREFAIAGAIAAGVVLLLIALAVIWSRPAEYAAEARVVIVPAQTEGDVAVTSLDTLSRGTVVETFAQVLASPRVRFVAFRRAGLPSDTSDDVKIETGVLSGTAIVRIVATGRDATSAERAADAIARHRPDLAGYTAAFKPLRIVAAQGSAERAGPSPLLLSIALVAALLLNAALIVVLLRRRSNRAGEPVTELPREPGAADGEAKTGPQRISAGR